MVLSIRYQLVLPRSLRKEILTFLHSDPAGGHFGVRKTVEKVKEKFYWPSCSKDVALWCSMCSLCSSRRGPVTRQKARLGRYVIGAPLERVAIDVMVFLLDRTQEIAP